MDEEGRALTRDVRVRVCGVHRGGGLLCEGRQGLDVGGILGGDLDVDVDYAPARQ
eukprot:SAG31_NODE_2894_length_4941_cov_45.155340_5_plen_55_part_00